MPAAARRKPEPHTGEQLELELVGGSAVPRPARPRGAARASEPAEAAPPAAPPEPAGGGRPFGGREAGPGAAAQGAGRARPAAGAQGPRGSAQGHAYAAVGPPRASRARRPSPECRRPREPIRPDRVYPRGTGPAGARPHHGREGASPPRPDGSRCRARPRPDISRRGGRCPGADAPPGVRWRPPPGWVVAARAARLPGLPVRASRASCRARSGPPRLGFQGGSRGRPPFAVRRCPMQASRQTWRSGPIAGKRGIAPCFRGGGTSVRHGRVLGGLFGRRHRPCARTPRRPVLDAGDRSIPGDADGTDRTCVPGVGTRRPGVRRTMAARGVRAWDFCVHRVAGERREQAALASKAPYAQAVAREGPAPSPPASAPGAGRTPRRGGTGRARRRRFPGPGEHRGGGMDPGRHVGSPRPAPPS